MTPTKGEGESIVKHSTYYLNRLTSILWSEARHRLMRPSWNELTTNWAGTYTKSAFSGLYLSVWKPHNLGDLSNVIIRLGFTPAS